jgi:hypothetical protein
MVSMTWSRILAPIVYNPTAMILIASKASSRLIKTEQELARIALHVRA